MIKFEKVSRFKDVDFPLPERKTSNSAGYDLAVAEDKIIEPISKLINLIKEECIDNDNIPWTLAEIKDVAKAYGARPTLVSTGVKCYLEPNTYLELSVRSSTPLNYLLVLANGVGIIDADYADNPDNEGEIYLQLINIGPAPIYLKKGDIIGQGIIKHYLTVDEDKASGERKGGFGSTTK